MAFAKTTYIFLLVNCLLLCTTLAILIKRDKFPVMLQRVGKIMGKCTWMEMHYAGVVRHAKSDRNWPIEFVSNVSLVNFKDTENGEEFEVTTHKNILRKHVNLHTFLILTYSTSNFQRLIRKLSKTDLWNPLGQYLILDELTDETGCQNALAFLNMSWAEDLLYSTYFCIDPKDGFTLYSYNPYTRKAPHPWKEIHASQYTFQDHVWSFFRQKLIPGRTVCRDFSFEKTTTMDGHLLNGLILQSGLSVQVDLNKPGFTKVFGAEGDIIMTALEKLKPDLNLTVVWNNSNYYDYHRSVNNGEWDIFMNSQYIFNKPGMTLTYPHEDSGIRILTQLPENEKQYMRVLSYMNPILIGLLFLVFLVTSIVLFICTRKGVIPSSLESYRLLLGIVITRSPRRNPLRIYVISISLLYMLTSSVFQSSLSSLLTVPIHKPYIDSADDIRLNPDLLVYVFDRYAHVVGDEWIKPQIRSINTIECVKYVKANPKAACAGDQTALLMDAIQEDLHLSRDKMATLYLSYIVRPNWPLRDRLSFILTILSQTGIVSHLRHRKVGFIFRKWAQREKEQWSTRVYHVMTLSELIFAFYILLFGLGLATLVFFFELYVARGKIRKLESEPSSDVAEAKWNA